MTPEIKQLINQLIDDSVSSKQELSEALENLLSILIKIEQKNSESIDNLEKKYTELLSAVLEKHSTALSELKKQVDEVFVGKQLDKIKQEHQSRIHLLDERIKKIKDGKDGKQGLRGEKGPAGSPDHPLVIRDKLESLRDDMRLNKSAICGLDNLEETINGVVEKAIKSIPIGGGGQQILRVAKFSFTGDGATTSFTLPKEPAGNGLLIWAYYQGQWLQPTVHFTVSKRTLATTFTPNNGTIIEGFLIII